jgi:Uma2 family endonuclease
VLSPGTASHDQVRKLHVYERAGVREYWLVHPIDRVITIYRLDQDGYGKPSVSELGGETPVAVLEDVVIRWDQLLERLPPVEP